MAYRMPIRLHVALRTLLPVPLALTIGIGTAVITTGIVTEHAQREAAVAYGPEGVVAEPVEGGCHAVVERPSPGDYKLPAFLGAAVLSFLLICWALRRIPVCCPNCAGQAFACITQDTEDIETLRLYACRSCGTSWCTLINPGKLIAGGFFLLSCGLTGFAFFGTDHFERILLFFVAGALVMASLWVWWWPVCHFLRDIRLAAARLNCRNLGALAIMPAVGTSLMLIAWLDPRDEAFPAGRGALHGVGLLIIVLGSLIALPQVFRLDRRVWGWFVMVLSLLAIAAFWGYFLFSS